MANKTIVVIGGGLGGISLLRGYHVLFEKTHIGGKVNRLETEGFGFDLGPSILTMPHIFENLFYHSNKEMADYVTIERLPLQWRSFYKW